MLTLTVAHGLGDDLKALRMGVAKAWRYLLQGTRGARLKGSLGMAHYVRALEVTRGELNGWHPHCHLLLFTPRELDKLDEDEIWDAWQDCVRRALGEEHMPNRAHGVSLKPSHRDDYIAKLGLEVASITHKRGKKGSRSPWQVAGDAAAGDRQSQALWVEYGSAMMGARQLSWSRGTRRFFGLRADDDDGVLAAEAEVGTCVAAWSANDWDRRKSRERRWLSRVTAALTSETPLASLDALGGGKLSRPGVVSHVGCDPSAVDDWLANNSHRVPPTIRRTAVAVFSEANREWDTMRFRQLMYR